MIKKRELSYSDFIDEVISLVRKNIGKGFLIEKKQVIKNNGVILDGILIRKEDEKVIPNIYLNEYYNNYLTNISINDIVNEIIKIYNKSRNQNHFNEEFSFEYNTMKENIVFRIINYEKNKILLNAIPHDKIYDLAIIYYCSFYNNDELKSIQITNKHLNIWNVTPDIIRKEALVNTERLFPYKIQAMISYINEMNNDDLKDYGTSKNNFYVLTNEQEVYGASCILYKGILEKFYNQVSTDFYILPSSIHELILVPICGDHNHEDLKSMVKEINNTQVSKEEVLSDNAYLYSEIIDELKGYYTP